MNRPQLSAVIISFNEERNLGRCLESLKGIADEVVVVDSGSSDDTVAIARSCGALVFHHDFEGHIEQKNWAAEQATGEWIISLDADEALSEGLKQSLQEWKTREKKHLAYEFNRLTSYAGQWVRHGGWYPDRKLRLWSTGSACWKGENPHDRLELISKSSIGFLQGDLLHYSYYDVEDHIRQIRYFSDIAAHSFQGNLWQTLPLFRPVRVGFQWFKNIVLKGGWRDGKTGWTIAKWSAFATGEKYRKARGVLRKKRLLQQAAKEKVQRVLICRTDAIGDVALTLPLAGWLAPHFEVDFLVRSYAAPVARASQLVKNVRVLEESEEMDFSEYEAAILAYPDAAVARRLKVASVPIRIGSGRRWPFRRFVNFRNSTSRKHSGKHETWHGMELAYDLHLATGWYQPGLEIPELKDWIQWGKIEAQPWHEVSSVDSERSQWIQSGRKHIILHPGSNNSAVNWSVESFGVLQSMALEAGFRVVLTGTKSETDRCDALQLLNPGSDDVINTAGKLDLSELISMIQACDGLVAASTGPLHLAAGLGIASVGLFANEAPIWAERWHPVGANARWLSSATRTSSGHLDIQPSQVWDELLTLLD